jgi:hypothetical protein
MLGSFCVDGDGAGAAGRDVVAHADTPTSAACELVRAKKLLPVV